MSVRITTLGQVRVSVADRDRSSLPQQRLRCALLIYLAVERDCARESLLGVFWPDRPQSRARPILNQCLYELRHALGDDAILSDADRVVIGPDIVIDVREFERDVEHGAIESALRAYHGPFLDGFVLPNNHAFEQWADRRRASLERLHRRARRDWIRMLEAADDRAGALAAARDWADADPLEDEAQHKLFELLLAAGERIEARKRFDEYTRLLREELDVAPLDQTVVLFEAPVGETDPPVDAGAPDRPVTAAAGPDRAAADNDRARPEDSDRSASSQRGEEGKGVPAAVTPSAGAAPAEVQPADTRTAVAAVDVWPGRPPHPNPLPPPGGEGISLSRPLPWRMTWRRAVVAALGVAVVAFIAARLFNGSPNPQSLALPIDPAGYDPSRIAVLYFEDLSEGRDVGHIASGLTEALITELDRVEALSVVSRDGVKPFVDSVMPPQQIAAALRAGSIVAGSLQRSGDQLRLTVQLVEGATGNLLESAAFQRPMGELFELQDDLAHRVSRFLRDRIGREVSVRRLTRAGKPEAWELVRRAIERGEDIWLAELPIMHERRAGATHELDAAEEYLRRAEHLDPEWPEPTWLRGWLALGRAKVVGAYDTAAYNREIRAGLSIVDGLFSRGFNGAREHELRGTLRLHLARVNHPNPSYLAVLDSAEQDLRLAVSRDPTLAAASNRLSSLLHYAGNPREARYYANHALQQDAYLRGGPDIQHRLFITSLELSDVSAARGHCLSGWIDYPRDWRFFQCQLLIGVYGDAPISPDSAEALLRSWARLDPPRPDQPPEYAYLFRRILYVGVLARAGLHESARDSLERIRHKVEQNPERLARPFGLDEASLLLMLGDTVGALHAVSRYVAQNPMFRTYVKRGYQVKALHDDPRFLAIVRDTVSF